jgi:thymidylate synthase (FAD)
MFGYLPTAIDGIKNELIGHIIKKYDCYELFGYNRHDMLPLLSTGVDFIENSPYEMSEEEWIIHGWASVHMITDRGISHEIVRHREETSFAQESTRYCNYSKDKFGSELTVIDQGFDHGSNERFCWKHSVMVAEDMYNEMMVYGIKPDMARSVLPTCLKTEIVMTAPMYEWKHFFDLRMLGVAGKPHPLIKELSTMVYDSIQEAFYGTDKN